MFSVFHTEISGKFDNDEHPSNIQRALIILLIPINFIVIILLLIFKLSILKYSFNSYSLLLYSYLLELIDDFDKKNYSKYKDIKYLQKLKMQKEEIKKEKERLKSEKKKKKLWKERDV